MNINFTLVMQAVAFTAFIWFTAKFVWPPLMRAIEARQKQIADGLAAGEQGRASLASAEKRITDLLTEARTKASEIVAQGEKFRGETVELAKVEAKAEAERIVAAAKAEIEQEVARAKEQLRNQVADLAVAGASRILAREVDAKAHAEILSALQRQIQA
jgi:F-type H+-transporting ATPase subunit b